MLNPNSKRIIPLEASRGIAAFIVVLHHFLLGFNPALHGWMGGFRSDHGIAGTVLFVFINGPAAVVFFFVLSGFVLTIGIFLKDFALNGLPSDFKPNFFNAFWQGAFRTVFKGDHQYNSNLWTMKIEFYGSFLAMSLAYFLTQTRWKRFTPYFFALVGAVTCFIDVYYLAFVIGAAMAHYQWHKKIGSLASIFYLLVGLYLLAFIMPEKHFAWTAPLLPIIASAKFAGGEDRLFHISGSVCLILGILSQPFVFRCLDSKFGQWIGRLSFPLYLCHVLVICSISSYVFLALQKAVFSESIKLWIVFGTTVFVSIVLAQCLAIFDDWWVRFVTIKTKKYYHRPIIFKANE